MLYEKNCDLCGDPFTSIHWQAKQCPKCTTELFQKKATQRKRAEKSNNKIIDEAREAAKLGLSYGQYKGKGGKI